MNPKLSNLQPYPFEKLAKLHSNVIPPRDMTEIVMSIGEPKHATPQFIKDTITSHLDSLAYYPTTQGTTELRETIAVWLTRRFNLKRENINSEQHIIPCHGTREALFAIAQCVIDPSKEALAVIPNPFYQIYEGAILLAGAEPWYWNLTSENSFLPDLETVPKAVWEKCQLLYLCNPGNPTGAVLNSDLLRSLIELANKYDFVIASDECYSEIYPRENEPPIGLLEAASQLGCNDYNKCIIFHSLSKRSSVPGLRSGFIAGDSKIIEKFRLYRTYHGCAMPPPTQAASIRAWQDEIHVKTNRALYRNKFEAAMEILSPVTQITYPEGGFYLWLKTPIDDQLFAQELYKQYNVKILPGSYLSRVAHNINPGQNYVRIALVPSLDKCIEAIQRLKKFIVQLKEKND